MGSSYFFICDKCSDCEYIPITPFEPSDPGEEIPAGWEWTDEDKLYCSRCKEKENEWPKTVKTYLHGSKENGYDLGEEIGLTGDALAEFRFLHYEVELTIEVEKDGNYTITHVDGKRVER